MESKQDYRYSHSQKGYGKAYHKLFNDNPHRKYLWELEKEYLESIVSRYYKGNIESYLDFACGTGRIIGHLERHTKNPIGLDISKSMLEVAGSHCTMASFIQGDITRENILENERFDLITAFRFFLNAQQPLRSSVMKELSKRLKSGGYLVFNIHNNKTGLTNQISKIYTTLKYLKFIPRNEMSVREVKKLLHDNGLDIVEMIPYATFPVFNEEKKVNETMLRFCDKYMSNSFFSTYIIYVCRLK